MDPTVTGARPTGGAMREALAPALRSLAIAVAAGLSAGIAVGGAGGRVVMRISAVAAGEPLRGRLTENGNVVGEITLEGTAGLVAFAGVGSALVGIGMFLVTRIWLPRAWLPRGLALGALTMVVFGTGVIDPSNADFVILGNRALNVWMFAALFPIAGVAMSWLVDRLERRAARGDPRVRPSHLLALPVGVLGAAATFAPTGARSVPGAALLALAVSVGLLRVRGSAGLAARVRLAGYPLLAWLFVDGTVGFADAVRTIV